MGRTIAKFAAREIKRTKHPEIPGLTVYSETLYIPHRTVSDKALEEAKNHFVGDDLPEPPILSNYGAEHFGDQQEKLSLEQLLNSEFGKKFYAREVMTQVENQKKTPELPVPINLIKGGDLMIVTFPGEIFVELGLEIKKKIKKSLYVYY